MMKSRTSLVAGVAALLLTGAACSEPDAPTSTKATIDIVAYIDNDASGNISAGDEMLNGVQVSVMQNGTVVGTATTNENGHAFVSGVAPGGYTVELTGAPTGAALITNSRPTAVVNAQGDTAAVEFRFVYFPGKVEGVVYRDDDNDGVLDDTDTRGAGLWVYLHASTGGAVGAKLDSVRTDNSGTYRFGRVAPGDYFVDFEQPTTITYSTTGPQAVTVAPQATASLNRTFTGSLILTVAEVRAKNPADAPAVAIEGVITAPPGAFTSGAGGVNSEIWVQDATGGIAVFSVLTSRAAELPLGQRVRVTGTLGAFGGQLQITSPTVTPITGGSPVSPTGITGASLAARTHEGKLVTLPGFTVTSIGGGTSPSFNVTGTDASGATVTVRVGGASTGLTRASFTVGQTYTVTGMQTVFISSGGAVTPQIKPRFSTDVELQASCPAGPGKVVITELMPDPSKVVDDQGEYFEIYNAENTPVNLEGWTFKDASASATPHTITGITIGACEYRVFGPNANSATNGGVTVDQQYTPIFLNNGSDHLVLKNAAGVTVDSVAYTSRTVGAAFGIIDPTLDTPNMNGANWQLQTSTYGLGDFGTPRARNDGQVGPGPSRTAPVAASARRTVSTATPRGDQ